MQALLAAQRAAFLHDGPPPLAERLAALRRLKRALQSHETALVAAVSEDFGHRSRHETLIADLAPTIQGIDHLLRHLPGWVRPARRSVALHFLPARARVEYQPLGVVGVLAPWNYPIFLSIPPLATAIAAGNRVMLKPSEFTPATAACLSAVLAEVFPKEQVAVVTGGAEVAAEFAALPFDHLFFTGSTAVGRRVMQAASANLVPVTLELGGKSPVIVDGTFPMERAAHAIAIGKLFNAGQTCVAPDYALVPRDRVDEFVACYARAVAQLYPSFAGNTDFTAIVNSHHHARLTALLADAEARGARVITIGAAAEAARTAAAGKLSPAVLLDVTDAMGVMQEEIFGPLLPVLPYGAIEEAIGYVNARPRPLALYLFSNDPTCRRTVLDRTTSGGVTLNDTALHVLQESLPFGGVGASGMGAYHGIEGFRTFSHPRAVFQQARWNIAALVRPPYGPLADRLLRFLLR